MSNQALRLLAQGDPVTGMQPSDLTPEDSFTTADKTELIHSFHTDETNGIYCGVWKCAPCREEIDAYPENEMMVVISGSLTITDPQGKAQTFQAGDSFFIAKGTKLTWEITETLHKYYMIAE